MAKFQNNQGGQATARVLSHPAATRQPPARILQRLWERWQSFANDRLRQLLLDLDDDLFARADAAENSVMQEMYFNAMRLLRYQSDEIRTRFATAITASATVPDEESADEDDGDPTASIESRLETLTLIDEDVLEQRLAVATMTQRFERAHTLEVLLAQRRIEALQEQVKPGSAAARISFDAKSLAEAFASSLGPLELDLRIRLVVFKHFENEVMEPLAGLFHEFNEMLVQAGVLPKLDLTAEARSRQARNTQEESPREPAPVAEPTAPEAAYRQVPSHLEEAAAGWTARPAAMDPGARPLLPPGFDLETAIKRRSALMRKLPALRQRRRFEHDADISQRLDVATVLQLLEASERVALRSWRDSDLERLPERLDLGAFLLDQAQRKGRSDAALEGADEDTVNLLQMLFDLILNDDHLAIPMRALIARLQLPMLRVALVDASFFSASRHPARRFLNAISRAGIGWGQAEEKSRDRLYAGIEELVQRAGSEFAGDVTLFDELRKDLDGLLAAEAERIKLAEARVIAQEQARIKADRTRRIVTRLIQHRLACAPPLPAQLEHFLKNDWQQVLMRAHGDPAPWQAAFAVLRRLTGSGTGPDGADLHAAIVDGMALLSMPSAGAHSTATEMLAFWTEAEKAEADKAAKQAEQQAEEAKQESEQAQKALQAEWTQSLQQTENTERAEQGQTKTTTASAEHQQAMPDVAATAAATLEDPQAELAELTAAVTKEAEELPEDAAAPSPAAMAAAQAIAEQTWVELHTRSDKLVRCRLASIIKPPERCVFLNRRGLRIDTLSRLEMAQAIDQGRLRVLDDRQLFDRALEQVIGGLRSPAPEH